VLARRVAVLATLLRGALEDRTAAAAWAERIVSKAESDPDQVVHELSEVARERAPLSGPFVLALASALQTRGGGASAVEWLEHRLRARRLTLNDVERLETQRETQWQGSIANAVLALRGAAEADWTTFVEALSAIEQTLREDPAGVYATMDKATRDRYRHQVEQLARRSTESEFGVAERALSLAREAAGTDDAPRTADHVGHWLVGAGEPTLARSIGHRQTLGRRLLRGLYRYPTAAYLGSIAVVTALGLAVPSGSPTPGEPRAGSSCWPSPQPSSRSSTSPSRSSTSTSSGSSRPTGSPASTSARASRPSTGRSSSSPPC
jgi:cyclic beta-1,2-glucan synthetase